MLILIFFTCLVTNISIIKCTEIFEEINVEINNNMSCIVDREYKLPAGVGVVVKVTNKSDKKINIATVEKDANDQVNTKIYTLKMFNKTVLTPEYIPNDSYNKIYTLFFKFTYKSQRRAIIDNHPMCQTKITYHPISNKATLPPEKSSETWHMYMAIVGVVAGIIIIALLATTFYYKRQANMLSKHIYLERRTQRPDENDRYCSNPRKAKKVSPILNNNRDSDIYEDPQIALGVPSMPPALPTSPRPNRNFNSTLKKPASPSLTLKSNASHLSLTRPRAPDKETQIKLSMAQRPPLPLPQDEFYPAAPEDTYEEPPVPEKPTPTSLTRKPGPPEKIGTIPKKIVKPASENIMKPRPEKMAKTFEEKLGKTLQNIPMGGLKPPGMSSLQKPAVPSSKPTPPRNNVVQVPIRQIPDSSSLKKGPLVKPKPNAKPKTPPSPTIEEVQFFNEERRDSTDDEYWTYEPLPQYNIYNN